MQYEFQTVDVFTDRRFGGNPLAVLPRAEGLDTAAMHAIAAEFNLSETVFVLPAADPGHTARLRIFTPRAELAFAGHPNVGAGFVLAAAGACYGRPVDDAMIFEEGVGTVHVVAGRMGDSVAGASVGSPQPLTIGAKLPIDAVAACCGLEPAQLDQSRHAPCVISCGNPFAAAQVRALDGLAAAAPQASAFARHLPLNQAAGLLLYVATPNADTDIRARVFAPLHGIPEDPATGSAILPLAGLVASLADAADAELSITVAQGLEMGRPSRLEATAEKRAGEIVAAWIGGACVAVAKGTIEVG